MQRNLLLVIAILLIAAIAALYWFSRPLPVLTVTSWAGPYGRAQAAGQMRPYAAQRSVDVRIAQWDGELAELEKAVSHKTYKGDVIDFELPTAVKACRKGLLEKLDGLSLPDGDDGTPAARDFVPGAIGPCWVGGMVYAQVMVFAPSLHRRPATLADFFDLKKFPGRRALSRATPKFNLEMALLADGVAPADIYKTLETPAGLERAFSSLSRLKPIWAHDSVGALRWVANGQAVMAAALNGDVHDSSQKDFAPGVIWDHQIYEMDVFAIPRDNPNKKRALDFIAFATGSAPLASVANWVPFGPARRSSIALVGDNPDTHQPMRSQLPTAPENFRNAFAVNAGWWLDHEGEILPRWQAFVMRR